MTVETEIDRFWSESDNQTLDALRAYTKAIKMEVAAVGVDEDGDPAVIMTHPQDDPAIARPQWPLFGGAAVGDWLWVLLTEGNGLVLGSIGAGEGGSGGVTDHGLLTGLGDDDHPQYALDTEITAINNDIAAIEGDITAIEGDVDAVELDILGHEARISDLEADGGGGGGGGAIVGEIKMWPTNTAPSGYLMCDGGTALIADFPALAALLGTTFGGDGVTTFGKPDFRGRSPMGVGTGDATDATAHALGEKEGAETHTLLTSEQSPHDHGGSTGSAGSHAHGGATNTDGSHTHTSTSAENGHSHAYSATLATNTTTGGSANRLTTLNNDNNGNNDADTNFIPAHSHSVNAGGSTHAHTIDTQAAHTHTIPSSGGGGAHNNQHPTLGINFIIKT